MFRQPHLSDLDGDGDLDVSFTEQALGRIKLLMNVADMPVPVNPSPGNGTAPTPRPALAAAPNPFTSTMRVTYALATDDVVTLSVYDVAGRRVRVLQDAAPMVAGLHHVAWDGATDGRRSAAPGVYFVQIESTRLEAVRRIVRLP